MFEKFIKRPVLAIVISIVIVFMGGLAIKNLPISQFPSVAPPSVMVSIAYPGASAKVLVNSVIISLSLSKCSNSLDSLNIIASYRKTGSLAKILKKLPKRFSN